MFADVCEGNTPKEADFKLQGDVKWLTKFLTIRHLALTSRYKPDPAHQWQDRGWNVLFGFVLGLCEAILHCKWKYYRSEIDPNGNRVLGTFGHRGFRKLWNRWSAFDFTNELLQKVTIWACTGECQAIVSFMDHGNGSKDRPGWHHDQWQHMLCSVFVEQDTSFFFSFVTQGPHIHSTVLTVCLVVTSGSLD